MMRVKLAKKPIDFDEKVLVPGSRAISEMVGQTPKYPRIGGQPHQKVARVKNQIPPDRFPPYWTEALDDLMTAYGEICAYSAFRIHRITGARSADHMVAKSRSWRDVYKWENYRLACSRLNSRKREFEDVVDPFKVKPGWFWLNLFTFEVEPATGLDQATTDLINSTIKRLGLNDFKQDREEYAEDYLHDEITLKILKREAPFIAYELFRQGQLNAGDIY